MTRENELHRGTLCPPDGTAWSEEHSVHHMEWPGQRNTLSTTWTGLVRGKLCPQHGMAWSEEHSVHHMDRPGQRNTLSTTQTGQVRGKLCPQHGMAWSENTLSTTWNGLVKGTLRPPHGPPGIKWLSIIEFSSLLMFKFKWPGEYLYFSTWFMKNMQYHLNRKW